MSEHLHTHVDEHGNVIEHCHDHHHDVNDITDYNEAVNAYRKTFPNKQRVIDETPDPAVRAMLLRMEQLGIDNAFDRFDKQQPQCNFGLAGICCRICHMGPCRITKKSPRGVCGADADLIVARNLLRAVAAGNRGQPHQADLDKEILVVGFAEAVLIVAGHVEVGHQQLQAAGLRLLAEAQARVVAAVDQLQRLRAPREAH